MESVNTRVRGASPIAVTAALSIAILFAAIGSYIGERAQAKRIATIADAREPAEAQRYVPLDDSDANGIPDWQDELVRAGVALPATSSATSTGPRDPAETIGSSAMGTLVDGYLSLKQYDAYTPERGEQLAQTIATSLRLPANFVPHTSTELTTKNDVSQDSILRYRADMRVALEPMVDFEAEPEFSLFARYIQTGDSKWLDELTVVALDYKKAEEQMLRVTVPVSATAVHLQALNTMGKFRETLERLVRFANDPLATMALLRTYNEAERDFILAFDALAKYYVQSVTSK